MRCQYQLDVHIKLRRYLFRCHYRTHRPIDSHRLFWNENKALQTGSEAGSQACFHPKKFTSYRWKRLRYNFAFCNRITTFPPPYQPLEVFSPHQNLSNLRYPYQPAEPWKFPQKLIFRSRAISLHFPLWFWMKTRLTTSDHTEYGWYSQKASRTSRNCKSINLSGNSSLRWWNPLTASNWSTTFGWRLS